MGRATGGWGLSGTSIYQTGYPFTVFTSANFWNGGDYNADGDTFDFPDVSSYNQGTSRRAYTTSVFTAGQFTAPTSVGEGNEKFNQFRNPSFVQTDMTIYKNTHITERLNFQMRFEFFNLFNHANFQNIQGNLSAGSSFGKVAEVGADRREAHVLVGRNSSWESSLGFTRDDGSHEFPRNGSASGRKGSIPPWVARCWCASSGNRCLILPPH